MSDPHRPDAARQTLADLQGVGAAAREAGGQAMQAGASALGHAKDVAQDATARAAAIATTIGDRASSIVEDQKGQLADTLEDVAKAVHRSGAQLEGHQDWVAHMVERGAAELGALATTLRTNDLQSLLANLGSLAQRQPALFVGASMAAGFALTRVGRLAVSAPAHAPGPAAAAAPSAPAAPGAARIIPATEAGGAMEIVRERQ